MFLWLFCVDAAISSSVSVCYFVAAASTSFVSPRGLLKAEVIIAFQMSGSRTSVTSRSFLVVVIHREIYVYRSIALQQLEYSFRLHVCIQS